MKIDIWSDVVCPWCWVGKHRFLRGVALLGDKAPALEVLWHPYLLDADADDTPIPLLEAYIKKFGGQERAKELLATMQATAQGEGLPMDFDRGQVRVTTIHAHRLLWLAGREGDVNAVSEALFAAHFAQGQNLADLQVLVDAGAAGGLSEARVRQLLDGNEGLQEVMGQLRDAHVQGVEAVPTFVIDGRYVLQGAQPPEVFAEVIGKVMAERDKGAVISSAVGSCGADGCDI